MAINQIDVSGQMGEIVALIQDKYVPSYYTTMKTQNVDLTSVSGPRGSGKNTLMTETGLHVIVSDTTRDPQFRDGKQEEEGIDYYFRGNDIGSVYTDVLLGKYVQIEAVDLGEKGINIYGTRGIAYPTEGPAVIDVVAPAVAKIKQLRENFASIESAYVVTRDVDMLIDRLNGRGKLGQKEYEKTLIEAYESLRLAHDDKDMHYVLNEDKEVAAEELRVFAVDRSVSRERLRIAKNCARIMRRGLGDLLGQPSVFYLG